MALVTTEISHSMATTIVWKKALLNTNSAYYQTKKLAFETDLVRVLKKAFVSVTVIILTFTRQS